jgi:hypothetical protein
MGDRAALRTDIARLQSLRSALQQRIAEARANVGVVLVG